ncbi:SDR family oxidoreductase [Seleniivibrio sp.]|uniref:SDR family oxidoreductase n=1 Tax=Seleniivibrio sp. TaxID=2898801 RepID=UPI0025D9FD5E|nr:SDR family oxidoreductase [Seleniivibrio sp.]MCD8552529.1 SDR family oxidoreductase [Seleniivibrio sp.]
MKNILVTGGSKGIGKGIVRFMTAKGHRVFIADIDPIGEKTARETGAVFIKTDCADESAVKDCIAKCGKLDVLVNNAGIAAPARLNLNEITLADWQRVIDVNLTGSFLFAKYASEVMEQGHIINISSTRAFQSEPDTFAYSASKGGVAALTHSLAVSLGPDILVNCISPGWINTDENYTPTDIDHAQHPAGRVGTPNDIALAVDFIISSGFITGQNITIDGGMTVKMIYSE